MSISDRFRGLVVDVEALLAALRVEEEGAAEKGVRMVDQAAQQLGGLKERVGEIPRIRLEAELTPVLLKAHGYLDRARLILEEQGDEDRAASVWELEQKIYRLLNDL